MNHSIYNADKGTHLKIVAVALVVGIAMAGLGLLSHTDSDSAATQVSGVIKAGKPVAVSSSNTSLTR
jgi:hypothetical protein